GISIARALGADPGAEFAEGILKPVLGSKAEKLSRLADIGEAVSDVAGAKAARDLRTGAATHRGGKHCCYVRDRIGAAAADIDGMSRGDRALERQAEGACHVLHMHEISPLLAVLEYGGRSAV